MLRIVQLEQLEGLLLQLPAMVRQQELRNPEFPSRVRGWLTSLEGELAANRLYQAGMVATMRSRLVSAEQGEVPAGLAFRGRPTRSRVLNTVASQALQSAAEVVSAVARENRARVTDAARVAHQVVSAALAGGLVAPESTAANNTQYLRNLRQVFVSSGELQNAVVHIESLVGPHDALVLFDRAIAANRQVTQ